MNLCLFSDLAYQYEEISNREQPSLSQGSIWEGGEAVVRAADQPLSYLFATLKNKTARTQELISSDIAPGGELPFMTRTVPEGEHFQDLRFWDSNQIGEDRDDQPPSEDTAEQFQRYYSDTQAFAASSADQILISCRGTSEDVDWLRNLTASTSPFPYGPPSFDNEPAQVHTGFFGAFAFLQPYVEAYLGAFLPKTDDNGDPTGEEKEVIVCGHSLGGAIALLVAAYIRSEHTANVMLYTYGMPRAAELPFAEHYGPSGLEPFTHMRHVHHHDPVPRVPTTGLELNPMWLHVALMSPGAWPTWVYQALRDYDGVPYAHHGTLVYLPAVREEASMPVHGLQVEDLSSLMEILDSPTEPGSLDENRQSDSDTLGPIEEQSLEPFHEDERIRFNESLREAVRHSTVEAVRQGEALLTPLQSSDWLQAVQDHALIPFPLQRWYHRILRRLGDDVIERASNRFDHLLADHGLNAYAEVIGRRLDQEVDLYLDTKGPSASTTPAMQETTCSRQYSEITARILSIREELGEARAAIGRSTLDGVTFWRGHEFREVVPGTGGLDDDAVAIRVDIDEAYRTYVQIDLMELAVLSSEEEASPDSISAGDVQRLLKTFELRPRDFSDVSIFFLLNETWEEPGLGDLLDRGFNVPGEGREDVRVLTVPIEVSGWRGLISNWTGSEIRVHAYVDTQRRDQRVIDLENKLAREITRRNQLCRQQTLFFWATPSAQRPEEDELARLLQAFKNERSNR